MEFGDFFSHDEQSVREAAEILAEAKQGVANGDLTQSEFEELAQDVLEIGQMQELADTLERKIAIQAAVDILSMLVKAVPKP